MSSNRTHVHVGIAQFPMVQSPSLWNVTCAHGWQDGGGLYIADRATLTNTNVYANQADKVCSPFEPSLNFHWR